MEIPTSKQEEENLFKELLYRLEKELRERGLMPFWLGVAECPICHFPLSAYMCDTEKLICLKCGTVFRLQFLEVQHT